MVILLRELLDLVGRHERKLGRQVNLSRTEPLASLSKTPTMGNAEK
jgi:hypothetical protein